ncbi:MAG: hypothetical protein ACREIJ_02590 [Nitrospiraceae bacterium]
MIYAMLRAVDAAEADALRVVVVQDFDGVAVENANDGAGEVGGIYKSWNEQGCQQKELYSLHDCTMAIINISDEHR